MRLGLNLGYWGGQPRDATPLVLEAEQLGFDSIWTAEAYGSDAVTPLAWMGALTSKIKLGTGILQMPARTPAMTAMTAVTLDLLSGGRVLLGLGLSGPQVVEGWHGQPYGKPLGRTREYIEIVRRSGRARLRWTIRARNIIFLSRAAPVWASRSRSSCIRCVSTYLSILPLSARRILNWRANLPMAGCRYFIPRPRGRLSGH